MKRIEGIIFDIDGTLTSTNKLIFATFNHITEKYLGKKYSDEDIIKVFGPTEEQILKDWVPDKFEDAKRDYYKFYEDNHDKMVKVLPGMHELIVKLNESNIPLGVFTGKGRESSLITLRKLNLTEYFELIVTGDDVKNHKPSPEGILKFIAHHKLNRENVLMIGDAPADVMAANAAGVKAAAVLWDSYAKDEVEKMNFDYSFNTVEELSQFLDHHLNNS